MFSVRYELIPAKISPIPKEKFKSVLCEVCDGAEERIGMKNNILDGFYSLCGTDREQRNS